MSTGGKNLQSYLDDLREGKEGRPEQVQQGLEIYVGLWDKVVQKGIVSPSDDLETALAKVEALGGLYQAAEE